MMSDDTSHKSCESHEGSSSLQFRPVQGSSEVPQTLGAVRCNPDPHVIVYIYNYISWLCVIFFFVFHPCAQQIAVESFPDLTYDLFTQPSLRQHRALSQLNAGVLALTLAVETTPNQISSRICRGSCRTVVRVHTLSADLCHRATAATQHDGREGPTQHSETALNFANTLVRNVNI